MHYLNELVYVAANHILYETLARTGDSFLGDSQCASACACSQPILLSMHAHIPEKKNNRYEKNDTT